MFKKVVCLVLILMLFFFIGGCTDEEEPEEEGLTEKEELEEENPEQEEREEEEPEVEEPPEENDEEAPAPDDEEEKSSTADYDLEDMEFAWEGEIDFQANDLYDRMVTEEEIHFLYRKDEAIYYQSVDLDTGEEVTKKKVEDASSQVNLTRASDTTIKLHDYNDHMYVLIGENRRISEEAQEEQKMLLIDLEEDEVILSKAPVIENFTIPEIDFASGTYLPGFIYDATADGRYLMILHSFPGMSSWDNYLNHSTSHEKEDLEEENQEVLSQMKDVPLWVYDMKEQELIEIPYEDEIDVLVPYDVEGLENGVNMIFTEQEGWLTLDIKNRQVQKTREGGTYRRTEPGAPGVEQYQEGTLYGENLFFTNVQEQADVGGIPVFHYIWNFDGDKLEHVATLGPNRSEQAFYFNDHNGEIIVNRAAQKSEDEEESDTEAEYVERLYRLTVDEEKVLGNEGNDPVKSLQELNGFEVKDVMEFSVGPYEEDKEQLSILGLGSSFARPVKDFSHMDYGVLAGATIERAEGMKSPFFYAYRNNGEEEKIVEIDGANLVFSTDKQLIVLLDNQIQAFNLEEFFDKLEES